MGSSVRHGALSLYAALEVGTGHVEGRTVARHTSGADAGEHGGKDGAKKSRVRYHAHANRG